MKRDIITTDAAPAAIGPYSQAVTADNFVFVSGQLGIDPVSGEMPDSIEDQTKLALKISTQFWLRPGSSAADVVKQLSCWRIWATSLWSTSSTAIISQSLPCTSSCSKDAAKKRQS